MESVTTSLFVTALVALISALAVFAAAKVVEVIKLTKVKVSAQTWTLLWQVAAAAVRDAKQSALIGLLSDGGEEKKAYALKVVLSELAKLGIKVDAQTASTVIEAAYVEFKTAFEDALGDETIFEPLEDDEPILGVG